MGKKYKLIEKLEHLYTENMSRPHIDWYLLVCGHKVAVIQSDMRRTRCRCPFCAGKPYNPLPMLPFEQESRDKFESRGTIPTLDILVKDSVQE